MSTNKEYMDRSVYESYIGYAQIVTIFLGVLALVYTFGEHRLGKIEWMSPASMLLLSSLILFAAILFFCGLMTSNTSEDNNAFSALARLFERKDVSWVAKSATVVFGTYAFAVVLLVAGSGGSSESPFSALLLLGSSFGYSLANSKAVKYTVFFMPNVLFVLLLFMRATNTCWLEIDTADFFSKGTFILVMMLVCVMTWQGDKSKVKKMGPDT